MSHSSSTLTLALALLSAGFSAAQDSVSAGDLANAQWEPTPENEADAPSHALHDLHFSLTPYFWATSFSGDIGVRGISIDGSTSFIDIVNEADKVYGFMGALSMEYNRFVFQLNGSWAHAEQGSQRAVLNNGELEADIELDAIWFEFLGGYRLIDRPIGDAPETMRRVTLDAYAGGRVTSIDVDGTLRASASITLPDGEVLEPNRTASRDASQEWIEPFIGLRAGFRLDDHWLLHLRGDVGGFGVDGSEFSWQAMALLGYEWRLDGYRLALFGGYRALSQDYSSGDFEWDVVTHGPVLGASLTFSF